MSGAGCHCDTQCNQIGDCCSDYNLQCVNSITTSAPSTLITTCAGRCSSTLTRSLARAVSSSTCYCDPGCLSVGDCCYDYQEQCQKTTTTTVSPPSGSCVGKCARSLFRLSVRSGKMTLNHQKPVISFDKGRTVLVTISVHSTETAALTMETRVLLQQHLQLPKGEAVTACAAPRLRQVRAVSVTPPVPGLETAVKTTRSLVWINPSQRQTTAS